MSKPVAVREAKIQLERGNPEQTHYRIEIYPHPSRIGWFAYSLSVGGKVFGDGLPNDPFLHGNFESKTEAMNAATARLFSLRKIE